MTPAELTEYLDVLRSRKVLSAEVQMDHAIIRVVFGLDDTMPGEAPQPGAWKGPERLDDHSTFDLPAEPEKKL